MIKLNCDQCNNLDMMKYMKVRRTDLAQRGIRHRIEKWLCRDCQEHLESHEICSYKRVLFTNPNGDLRLNLLVDILNSIWDNRFILRKVEGHFLKILTQKVISFIEYINAMEINSLSVHRSADIKRLSKKILKLGG